MGVLFLAGGCDFIGADEPPPGEPESLQITFRIESSPPPNGGWVYWYVQQGVLQREGAGEGIGPIGARADCGTHAGMAAKVLREPGVPADVTLFIETVEDDAEEPAVAEKRFVGAGEHHLVVLLSCR